MRRRFKIQPVEPIVIEFADGTEKRIYMNNRALMIFFGELGGLKGDNPEEAMDSIVSVLEEMEQPSELATKLLYAGLKASYSETTMEEARNIMAAGDIELMTMMFEAMAESIGGADSSVLKKNLTPAVNRLLRKVNFS